MLDMSEALVERRIRCLLFDLGDTLWYRDHQESWDKQEYTSNQCAIKLLRQHIDSAFLPPLDDQALGQRLRLLFDEQMRTTIRSSPLLEPHPGQVITAVLHTWGLDDIDDTIGADIFEALRVRVPSSRPLFTDALSTLAELRQRGFLLGIVTNRLWGGQPFYEDLETVGLLQYFDRDHIAISGDLGIRKPNPEIFAYALRALQVSPQETAMIGDSLSADILGAQPLGMFTIWRPKAWLYTWAKEQENAQLTPHDIQAHTLSPEAFPGIDTADTQIPPRLETDAALFKGMYATDDDAILAHTTMSRDYLELFQRGEIRPDRIIGQLTELLEIFLKADSL